MNTVRFKNVLGKLNSNMAVPKYLLSENEQWTSIVLYVRDSPHRNLVREDVRRIHSRNPWLCLHEVLCCKRQHVSRIVLYVMNRTHRVSAFPSMYRPVVRTEKNDTELHIKILKMSYRFKEEWRRIEQLRKPTSGVWSIIPYKESNEIGQDFNYRIFNISLRIWVSGYRKIYFFETFFPALFLFPNRSPGWKSRFLFNLCIRIPLT